MAIVYDTPYFQNLNKNENRNGPLKRAFQLPLSSALSFFMDKSMQIAVVPC